MLFTLNCFSQQVGSTGIKETVFKNGIGIGSAIAIVVSWDRNKSILYAILHGVLGWLYVIYFVIFRNMKKKNRPSLKKIICIGIVILLSACSSHKRINKEASKIRCNKTIHFIFDEASNFVKIEYFGKETIGDSPYPNYKNTFKNSIIELNKITNAEIEFKQKLGLPTKSVMQVIMKIEKIVWVISRSSAVMTADLSFYVDGEKIGVIGENKVHWAGTKKGNLYKCLKNGTFNFLDVICSK